jgi:hypothetical protein
MGLSGDNYADIGIIVIMPVSGLCRVDGCKLL